MSTASRRSARGSSSTSARAAALGCALAVAWAAPGAQREPLRAAERELALTSGLYLVVTAEPPAAEVKARGLTLERLPLAGVAVLLRREAGGGGAAAEALPAVWRVSERGAVDAPRRLIAPADLVPEPEDGAGAPAAASEEAPLPAPPAEYRVGLDGGWEIWVGPELPATGPLARFGSAVAGGWEIWVGPELPATGPLARFGSAVAGGWRALWRNGPEPPPGAVAMSADAETARRLHHLFRAGLPVLVAGHPAAPAAAGDPGVTLAERRP